MKRFLEEEAELGSDNEENDDNRKRINREDNDENDEDDEDDSDDSLDGFVVKHQPDDELIGDETDAMFAKFQAD